MSAREVDEEGEDEVVVVKEVKQGEMRKRALSSPPKLSRKRVRAGTATQTPAGSQVKGGPVQGSQVGMGTAVSTANPCWRCVKHQVKCVMPRGGARCENCQAKHYGCLLVPLKEVVGGKGGPSGSQQAKAVVGSQVKAVSRKARKALTLGKSKICLYPSVTKRTCQNQPSWRSSNGPGLPAPSACCACLRRPSGRVSTRYVPASTHTISRFGRSSVSGIHARCQ